MIDKGSKSLAVIFLRLHQYRFSRETSHLHLTIELCLLVHDVLLDELLLLFA